MFYIRLFIVFVIIGLLVSCDFASDGARVNIEDSRKKSSVLSDACNYASYDSKRGFVTGYACYADQLLIDEKIVWEGKPIRFARIEILRNDDDEILATAQTTATGYYEVDLSDLTQKTRIRSRVVAAGTLSVTESAVLGQSGYPYALSSDDIEFSSSDSPSVNLAAVSAEVAPVFNILDQFVDAQLYLKNIVGLDDIPFVDAHWFPGNRLGTFYCPARYDGIECEGKDEFYVLGADNDSDAYDDVVLLHEYGHFVLDKFSRDDSPGGQHYVEDNDQDLRLSWSEGFSTAFAAMVRRYHGIENAEEFIDTDGNGEVLYNYYLELPLGGLNVFSPKTHSLGMGNELAVSVVLYDIVDTAHADEGFDIIEEEGAMWQSIFSMQDRENINMQDFIELWSGSSLTPVLNDRSIFVLADDFETSDEDINNADVVALPFEQQRTLHQHDDQDWMKVRMTAGQNYHIAVGQFLSGADVKLALYQSDGITPAFTKYAPDYIVDSDSAYYTKEMDFTPSTDGVYTIHFRRNDTTPAYVRYGSYQIKAY